MHIEIDEITKAFGTTAALHPVSLAIPSGALVALLGPSGSGKTTLLRILGGLEFPTAGRVLFDGQDATNLSVQDRRAGFVFQSYALFRHMTVFDNIAYGLTARPRASRPPKGEIERRQVGSLVAFETGEAVAYGLAAAQERGALFIGPGTSVYAGMVVGVCSRNEDMTVNVCKKKQLTNMRAAGSDEALRLTPPRILSLEQCLEFLADDELLECTPKSLRIRKRELDHAARMRNLMKKRAQDNA